MKMDMDKLGARDASEAVISSLTEAELAEWLKARGLKSVVLHNGRYWKASLPGFYHALHIMARMTPEEATRPTPCCWGFQTTLREEDAGMANGATPVVVVRDLDSCLPSLTAKRRNSIGRSLQVVRFVELLTPDLLLHQGYDVVLSAHGHNAYYGRPPSPERYRREAEALFRPRSGLVLACLVDGRLLGYSISYAVGPTAYSDVMFLHADALPYHVSDCIYWQLMEIYRRSGQIREVVNGLHAPERAGLCRYKERMGYSVVRVPARAWFAPLAGSIIRAKRPHAYYRLTGHY